MEVAQDEIRLLLGHARHISDVSCGDDGQGQGCREIEDNAEDTAHLPGDQNASGASQGPIGPEQIEKMRSAHYESHEDAGEDVVGCGTDVVVVEDVCLGCLALDERLLINVVCISS